MFLGKLFTQTVFRETLKAQAPAQNASLWTALAPDRFGSLTQ